MIFAREYSSNIFYNKIGFYGNGGVMLFLEYDGDNIKLYKRTILIGDYCKLRRVLGIFL